MAQKNLDIEKNKLDFLRVLRPPLIFRLLVINSIAKLLLIVMDNRMFMRI